MESHSAADSQRKLLSAPADTSSTLPPPTRSQHPHTCSKRQRGEPSPLAVRLCSLRELEPERERESAAWRLWKMDEGGGAQTGGACSLRRRGAPALLSASPPAAGAHSRDPSATVPQYQHVHRRHTHTHKCLTWRPPSVEMPSMESTRSPGRTVSREAASAGMGSSRSTTVQGTELETVSPRAWSSTASGVWIEPCETGPRKSAASSRGF